MRDTIAEACKLLQVEKRYNHEEVALERVRIDLETEDREQWLQNTLETEELLG